MHERSHGRRLATLALVLLGAVLGACSEDPRTAIVGAWSGERPAQDLRFFGSGRIEITDRKLGRRYEGACEIDDDGVMTCHVDGFHAPVVRSVRVRGDTLYLANRSGQEEQYARQ